MATCNTRTARSLGFKPHHSDWPYLVKGRFVQVSVRSINWFDDFNQNCFEFCYTFSTARFGIFSFTQLNGLSCSCLTTPPPLSPCFRADSDDRVRSGCETICTAFCMFVMFAKYERSFKSHRTKLPGDRAAVFLRNFPVTFDYSFVHRYECAITMHMWLAALHYAHKYGFISDSAFLYLFLFVPHHFCYDHHSSSHDRLVCLCVCVWTRAFGFIHLYYIYHCTIFRCLNCKLRCKPRMMMMLMKVK